MNKDELKLKVENCMKNAEKILQDTGEVLPMLDVEFTDEFGATQIIAVGLATGDDVKKRDLFIKGLGITLGAIKKLGKIKEVKCIVMMSEAWASTQSRADYEKGMPILRPSEDPNRKEMLITSGLNMNGDAIIRAKEMFSIEVKGKKYFTLTDIPEMNEDKGKSDSKVLKYFFEGYKLSVEQDNEKIRLLEKLMSRVDFKDVSLDQLLDRGIKVLTQRVGGLDSEIINYKII